MLFDSFPTTFFKLSDTNNIVVTDFIRAIKIDPSLKDNPIFFTTYEARDGDTPEIISHKFYKTTQYHWVIMVINEKFDPWRDFPQSDEVIVAYSSEKYNDINATHHYEDANGNVVDEFAQLSTPISNLEYERKLNETKRIIKIMKLEVVQQFVEKYKALISI